MSFQYTYNDEGEPVGVFVPIHEWEKLTSVLSKKKAQKKIPKKSAFLNKIKQGMQQVELIEHGKLNSVSLHQLLDEL